MPRQPSLGTIAPPPATLTTRTTACKLCLLGPPGVGKSSLAQRLLYDRFPAAEERPGVTLAALRLPSVQGESLTLMIWDVAGNSALDTLGQAYLSGVDAVAAVADAGSATSIAQALELIEQARRLHPGVAAALLLNKCDLLSARAVPTKLPPDVVEHQVSARDGQGVNAAFIELSTLARGRQRQA